VAIVEEPVEEVVEEPVEQPIAQPVEQAQLAPNKKETVAKESLQIGPSQTRKDAIDVGGKRTATEQVAMKKRKKQLPSRKEGKPNVLSKKRENVPPKPEALKPETLPLLVKPSKTIEDRTGFIGRRPKKDPFYPGEEVTFDISYLGISAGTMTIRTKSYVKVNGRKAYHFQSRLKSNDVFSRMYSVDDVAETYVDFAELVPLTYQVHIKESKKLQEGRAFFDWSSLQATKWEKKLTPDEGPTENKISWAIDAYAQNVFSAPFYMRVFPLFPGKKLAFRVADDGKNVTFTGEILRREVLETGLGKFKTLVLRPQIVADGDFKQEGDILFWLTDDDQKLIVGFEGKIRIGKIKASLIAIQRGRKPKK
jgi:hypothetical protein